MLSMFINREYSLQASSCLKLDNYVYYCLISIVNLAENDYKWNKHQKVYGIIL
jgi:hypothetical protein